MGYTANAIAKKQRFMAKIAARRAARPIPMVVQPVVRNRAPRIKGGIAPRQELKYVDVASAAYAADTTGSVTLLNGVAVGDDNTTRDGRQATMKSVQVRGQLRPESSSQTGCKCRLLLVWDNASAGATPTIADILTASTSNSFPLVNNARRFTILCDNSYVLGTVDTTATQTYAYSPGIHDVEIYKRIQSVTQYNGTGATAASIQNGALWMITIGDAANAGQFNVATRVRFTDD